MARLKATGSKKHGSLIYNPGGPGGVASQFTLGQAAQGVPVFSEALSSHYDIIGLDSRGVGMSQLVRCDPDIWNERVDLFATSDDKFTKLVEHNKKAGESCAKLTGPLLNHLDTIHVVHDLELVRRALGPSKLNFLALSYGSQIATQYAEYFPNNVGRFALDAVENHSQSETDTVATEVAGVELTLEYFFKWCTEHKSCALHGEDVASVYNNLVFSANKTPLPAKQCQSSKACRSHVTGNDIRTAVQHGLTQVHPTIIEPDTSFVTLSKALAGAIAGDASALASPLATSKVDAAYASLAIACQDWFHTAESADDIRAKVDMLRTIAPHVNGTSQSFQIQTACLGWPAPVSNPQAVLGAGVTKAPPMLLVASSFDPETSIVWANGVKAQLPTSPLVVRKGAGHASYFLKGDTSAAIDRYLVTGELPTDGAVYHS